MKAVILLIVFVFCGNCVNCANIFAAIPAPFYSHQATFRPLWRELAKRGHRITLITTNLMEHNENITQIDYSGSYEIFKQFKVVDKLKKGNVFELITGVTDMVHAFFDYQFTHPEMVKLLENGTQFDICLIELLIPVFPALSARFGCPYIGLVSMDAPPFMHGIIGNAEHPAIYPYADFGFGDELTFSERLQSTAFNMMVYAMVPFFFRPTINNLTRTYMGEDMPDVLDIQFNISMMFTNANPIFFPPRPVTPLTINLGGGLHLKKPEKLPKDIQDYLDKSKKGCIYFSFGSTISSNDLTEETINIFFEAFEELSPIRVLWKFQNESFHNSKPKNVELRKWFPQQDVLRHPNVKLFITQGGLQSMEEAIDNAVPMLGIPFYGDQKNNVRKMVSRGFGLSLNKEEITKESLKSTILELLENPKYRNTVEKLSRISKDQPMNRLETAVWWVEYVLRHGGTEHLKSPSSKIPIYQYFFLDIIAFVATFLIFLVFLFYVSFKIIRYAFKTIFCSHKNSKRKTE